MSSIINKNIKISNSGQINGDTSLTLAVNDSPKTTILSSGNVGVGTTTPAYKLDVLGDINFTGNLKNNGTNISFGGSSQWTTTGNDIYYTTGNVGIGTNNPGTNKLDVNGVTYIRDNLNVKNNNGGLTLHQNAICIDSNLSSIGIGTDSPQQYDPSTPTLNLYGNLRIDPYNNSASAIAFIDSSNQQSFSIIKYSDNSIELANMANTVMRFSTNNTERLRIQANGNVGIGTTNPSVKLDVNGNGLFRNGNAGTTFTNSQLLFSYSGGNEYIHNIKSRHNNAANDSTNALDFYMWQTSDSSTALGSKHVMTVSSSGVGIGTTNPTTALDVNGVVKQNVYDLVLYNPATIYRGTGINTYTLVTPSFTDTGGNYYYLTWGNNINSNFSPIVQNTVQYKVPVNGIYFVKYVYSFIISGGPVEAYMSKNKGGQNNATKADLNDLDGFGPFAYSVSTTGTLSGVLRMTTSDYLCFGAFIHNGTTVTSISPRSSVTITYLSAI